MAGNDQALARWARRQGRRALGETSAGSLEAARRDGSDASIVLGEADDAPGLVLFGFCSLSARSH